MNTTIMDEIIKKIEEYNMLYGEPPSHIYAPYSVQRELYNTGRAHLWLRHGVKLRGHESGDILCTKENT